MLPKKYRITFNKFYQNPYPKKYAFSPFASFSFKKSENLLPRFCIIVPKTLEKRSVYRHLTKRLIIESIRKHLKEVVGGFDIVIKSKRLLRKKESLWFENKLLDLFNKARLLKQKSKPNEKINFNAN